MKTYYKIIGNNNGSFPYKFGLNTLADNNEVFDPSPKCGPGGLYFCKIKDIFRWLNHGDTVCELSIPAGAQVTVVKDKFKSDSIYIEQKMDLNKVETFKYLILKGANVRVQNYMLLHHVNEQHRLFLLEFLIDNSINILNNQLLELFISKGYLSAVKFLVKHGVDIHADNNSALRVAINHGILSIVEFLADSGANIYPKHLILASKKGHLLVVEFLVERGADVHANNDCALRIASSNGHLSVVEFLVECGANVHANNDCALRIASSNGHLSVVEFLVECGANIHANNDCALKNASANGHLSVVKFLVERGSNNESALQIASANGHLSVVKFLVKKGAHAHIDALKNASANGHLCVVKFLLNSP